PPGIPRYATWLPRGTMLLTLVDVINAMDAVPGVFVAGSRLSGLDCPHGVRGVRDARRRRGGGPDRTRPARAGADLGATPARRQAGVEGVTQS
ncbi:MAG TPA: hypothetical protein VJ649_07850, partial [Actinomycetes bacterium]|nr:hypothetical protein [Actinomycetes bacterium]